MRASGTPSRPWLAAMTALQLVALSFGCGRIGFEGKRLEDGAGDPGDDSAAGGDGLNGDGSNDGDAAAPTNQTLPQIVGAVRDGLAVTATVGTWSGTAPITYAYQWRRCDAGGASCSDLTGATLSTYQIANSLVGASLRVVVTASNVAGSASAASPSAAVGSAWYDDGTTWGYRKPITVDSTQVQGGADLADFPILIDVLDPDLRSSSSSGLVTQAGGLDILFADGAGAKLDHEIDFYDGSAGRLVSWVRLPLLSASVDTEIYIYFGNAAVGSAQENPAGVWASPYAAVYHFGDGTTLDVGDSKGANNGTNDGATAGAGRIAGAASFNGAASISVGGVSGLDPVDGHTNTLEVWMYYSGALDKAIVGLLCSGGFSDLWFRDASSFGFNTGNSEVLGISGAGLEDTWVHIAAVFFNGVASPMNAALYINGVPQTLSFIGGGSARATTAWTDLIWSSTDPYRFEGLLDEGRLSSGTRSPGWIATSYQSQSSPSTFYSFGGIEPR